MFFFLYQDFLFSRVSTYMYFQQVSSVEFEDIYSSLVAECNFLMIYSSIEHYPV